MDDEYKSPPDPENLLPDLYQKGLIVGIKHGDEFRHFAIPFSSLTTFEVFPHERAAFYILLRNATDPEQAVAVLRDLWMRADGH